MTVIAFFGIPQSSTKGNKIKMENNDVPVMKRPDGDNLLKIVNDSLNGMAYIDDANIIEMICIKKWGNPARMEIKIEEINFCE